MLRTGPVQLVAVQSRVGLEDYRDAEAFRAMVMRQVEAVERIRLTDQPALVAFPEAIAMPLLWGLRFHYISRDAATLKHAALRIAAREWRAVSRQAWRTRTLGLHLLYLLQWRDVYELYMQTFADVARRLQAYVAAGTLFLPPVDEESSRGGLVLESPYPNNLGFLFNPAGRAIARTAKVNFVPEERVAGLRPGRVDDLQPVDTGCGRIGIAVCFDAFHESVLRRFDQLGTRILVQPSANDAPWDAPWIHDPAITQADAWDRDGLAHSLAGREWLLYGVNPMLVTGMWGMRMEGCSAIMANAHAVDGPWDPTPGYLARMPDPREEGVISASVLV